MVGNVTAIVYVQADGVTKEDGIIFVVGHASLKNVMENPAVVMQMSVKEVDVIAIHVDLEQMMDR